MAEEDDLASSRRSSGVAFPATAEGDSSGTPRRTTDFPANSPPSAEQRPSNTEARQSSTDEARRAKDICYALLTARPRTRVELRNALLRKGITESVAEEVLGKFDRAGLIDDASFAEVWVRSRHTNQGLGRRALAMELRRKGVDDAVVAEAVAAVDPDAEESRARELVRKRMRTMDGLEETTKIRRLVGALARKGYSEGLAFRVVREELRTTALDEDF